MWGVGGSESLSALSFHSRKSTDLKLKRKRISKRAYKYELFQNALQTYGGKYVFFFKWAKRVLSNIVTSREEGKEGGVPRKCCHLSNLLKLVHP